MADEIKSFVGDYKDEVRDELFQVQRDIRALRDREKDLKSRLKIADELIRRRAKACNGEGGPPLIKEGAPLAQLQLRDAVLKCIESERLHPLTIAEIATRLVDGGFDSEAKDLKANVSVVCRRLVDDHVLGTTMRQNRRMFFLNRSRKDEGHPRKGAPEDN